MIHQLLHAELSFSWSVGPGEVSVASSESTEEEDVHTEDSKEKASEEPTEKTVTEFMLIRVSVLKST